MTDRELLEAAAKAAGLYEQCPAIEYGIQGGEDGMWLYGKGMGKVVWNPLTDDGDALRLAVKLGIDLYVRVGIGCTAIYHDVHAREFAEDGDYCAATRRAIVRAAAQLHKAK